ncbi:MAG TPA: 50S ribosomal protein L25/general stress protein Ctc [Cytophagaceae bacterium]|jgi:large subunit ribosomal protein L25|nr:50S ribosomal protein L25/general stress protein Ctc [Cytophagaceae bacterium]
MKQVEIIGYKRANLGKKESAQLRAEAQVPCVLYGGNEVIHFSTPMFLFKDIIYTGDAVQAVIHVEGKKYTAILQDAQFHPVSEMILHADFLELVPNKVVKMDIPVTFEGTAPGVLKGGRFNQKMKKLTVKATPEKLPSSIVVNISTLELAKSVKVGDVKADGYVIVNAKSNPIATIEVTRSLKQEANETTKK